MQRSLEQQALVRQAIESGRVRGEEEAAHEAFSLWEKRERRRAEILAQVDLAEAELARDEGRIITEESLRQLSDDLKSRGRQYQSKPTVSFLSWPPP